MKRGFTLIELAIAVIIIGVLVGGLLIVRSVTDTSRIAAVMGQIRQFDAAVGNFKAEYEFLPGDAPAFGGDGDGLIELTAAGTSDNNITVYGCEIVNFWNNAIPDLYANNACADADGVKADISGTSRNVPEAKLGKTGSFFAVSAVSTDAQFADTTNPRNFYFIMGPTQAQTVILGWHRFTTTTSANSAVRPSDLLSLDIKIDDGIANAGNVLSGSIGDCCGVNAGGIVANPLMRCSSGGNYDPQQPGYECTPLIRVGAQIDDPQ